MCFAQFILGRVGGGGAGGMHSQKILILDLLKALLVLFQKLHCCNVLCCICIKLTMHKIVETRVPGRRFWLNVNSNFRDKAIYLADA